MNSLSKQTAKHFREAFFGGNWTVSNMNDVLKDITWKEAVLKIESMNTIATLVFHTNYFVSAVLKVLKGGVLDAHDKYSFDHQAIESEEDWQKMIRQSLNDAEEMASLIEQLPESKMWEDFTDKKYGNYFRNLHGIIEHTHYHLGQIAILKKIIRK